MTTTPEAKCKNPRCRDGRVPFVDASGVSHNWAFDMCPDCNQPAHPEAMPHDYHGLCRENKQLADELTAERERSRPRLTATEPPTATDAVDGMVLAWSPDENGAFWSDYGWEQVANHDQSNKNDTSFRYWMPYPRDPTKADEGEQK